MYILIIELQLYKGIKLSAFSNTIWDLNTLYVTLWILSHSVHTPKKCSHDLTE